MNEGVWRGKDLRSWLIQSLARMHFVFKVHFKKCNFSKEVCTKQICIVFEEIPQKCVTKFRFSPKHPFAVLNYMNLQV